MYGRQKDQVALCQAPKAVYPTILTELLEDSCLSSIRITDPLLKEVGEAATECMPGIGHEPTPAATYACQGYGVKGRGNANPNV